ncbi:hypothetical protein H4Q26_015215 [Puccinia striiformis f. sp. tritici PST-130]|nr:hypothetical protein H4Q26_015215 [Puccinia striiformis f. sp. tritici PST-130]
MASMIFNLFFILLSVITCIGSPVPEKKSQLDRLYSGKATWFIPDTGACGDVNSTEDYIVAMNHAQYQGGAPCHKTVSITNKRPAMPPCAYGSLDLSPSVFQSPWNMDDDLVAICLNGHGSSTARQVLHHSLQG